MPVFGGWQGRKKIVTKGFDSRVGKRLYPRLPTTKGGADGASGTIAGTDLGQVNRSRRDARAAVRAGDFWRSPEGGLLGMAVRADEP